MSRAYTLIKSGLEVSQKRSSRSVGGYIDQRVGVGNCKDLGTSSPHDGTRESATEARPWH
jgi:hypothetical protein